MQIKTIKPNTKIKSIDAVAESDKKNVCEGYQNKL